MTENKFQIDHKNDYEIKMTIIKKFIGKATSHSDHYMINMGGQMEKINGNWLLQAVIYSGDSVVASLTKSCKSFLLNLPL